MTDKKRVSMADAERKSLTKAKIVMGLATVLLLAMSYFNLFHTYLYMWQHKAAGIASVAGIFIYVAAVLTLFAEGLISNAAKNETLWYIIWIILLLAAITTSCGFNFSL